MIHVYLPIRTKNDEKRNNILDCIMRMDAFLFTVVGK